MKSLELKKDFYWAGMQDPNLRVFDIIMFTEFGTSYNSYVLKGKEKTAIFETAKAKCMDKYLEQLGGIVDVQDIDYIVVNHTEPDHAGSAAELIKMNPKIKVVGSASAIAFIKEITNIDFTPVVVKDGDALDLGGKTIRFIAAPNLHWPDSMYSYIEEDKTLISCDSFGCHYSWDDVYMSTVKNEDGYHRALKYYFDKIMGPFKPFVLKAIKKIETLEIDMICPGHGPVLDEKPWDVVNQYKEWATESNPNKKKTVVIPYVSAYGYTKEVAEAITEGIKSVGDIEVKLYDMVDTSHNEEVIEELRWADGILFGTPTILGDALKPIWDVATSIYPITHGGKIASAFGAYGWSGEGVPNMLDRLKQLKMKVYGEGLKIRFKPSHAQWEEAYEFGVGFGKSVLKGKIVTKEEEIATVGPRLWRCIVCGEIISSIKAPDACPVCGVGPEQFEVVDGEELSYKSEKDGKYLILGGGVAGLSAAEEIRKRNKVAEIEILSEEEVPCYNRPMITKGILSEFDEINFLSKQKSWYEENNIKVTLKAKAEKIDLSDKKIVLEDGSEKNYDKLIYALGAQCNRIPIPGSDRENVYTLRGLEDANQVRKVMDDVETVAVIGGGILGLEGAWEFVKAGKSVSVLEIAPGLMVNQLDEKGSSILEKNARDAGINVVCGASIDFIDKDCVVLKDGTKVPAEVVVISAGIKPNASLGVEAGLEGDRWITVDETMKTSDEDVYAAGDVAIYNGVSIGIWNQAVEMGKIAGINAVGDEATYSPIIPSTNFNGFNMNLFSIGDLGRKEGVHYKVIEVEEKEKEVYKKVYLVNDQVVGGILIGAQKHSVKLLKAYEKNYSFKDIMDIL